MTVAGVRQVLRVRRVESSTGESETENRLLGIEPACQELGVD